MTTYSIRSLVAATVIVAVAAFAFSPTTVVLPCNQDLYLAPVGGSITALVRSGNDVGFTANWIERNYGQSITVTLPRWKALMLDRTASYEIEVLGLK